MGFTYKSEIGVEVKATIVGREHSYTVLQLLEFTSDRKRMSIILRDNDTSEIILYSKGADDVILESSRRDEGYETVIRDLEVFAADGYRTLCVAYKILQEEEYNGILRPL